MPQPSVPLFRIVKVDTSIFVGLKDNSVMRENGEKYVSEMTVKISSLIGVLERNEECRSIWV